MSNPKTVSLAKRLLDSHIKHPMVSESESLFRITDEELAWAEEILTKHLDSCLRQGVDPDLTEAVEDALAFALGQDLAVKTEPMYEEALGDLDIRLAPPPMQMQKIKVKLNFIGNEAPRISYDPDND